MVPCRLSSICIFSHHGSGRTRRCVECGTVSVVPKSPSFLKMLIQSGLNVQTFSINEVPRQSRQNYLPTPDLLAQDDGINISNASRKWFFSCTIHCNESNLFSLKNCPSLFVSTVPRRQEERTSNIQMIFSPWPTSLKWFSLKVNVTWDDWFIEHLMMEGGEVVVCVESELYKRRNLTLSSAVGEWPD